jgi:hypothetical protein
LVLRARKYLKEHLAAQLAFPSYASREILSGSQAGGPVIRITMSHEKLYKRSYTNEAVPRNRRVIFKSNRWATCRHVIVIQWTSRNFSVEIRKAIL